MNAHTDSALSSLGRGLAFAGLIIGSAVAFAFAAAAAVVVGLMILGAAIALRLAPQPVRAGNRDILEARQTPSGWVVEAGPQRKS
jgi:hypothetical protein